MSFRKPLTKPEKPSARLSSDDDDSSTSGSDQESGGGAKFFASRPSALKKSKWLATQGSDSESDSESSESESSEDDDEPPEKKPPASRFLKTKPAEDKEDEEASEDESSDFSFLSESDEETSEESSEDDERPLEPEQRRSRWVKVTTEDSKAEEQKKLDMKAKVEKESKKAKAATVKETKIEKETQDRDAVAELLGEVTPNNVLSKLEVVMLARGRKGSDREVISMALNHLLEVAELPFQKIKLLFALVLFCFDYPSAAAHHLPVSQWKQAAARITEILQILENEPSLILDETVDELDEASLMELSTAAPNNYKKNAAAKIYLKCSLVSQIERLDDEFIKSLQYVEIKHKDYRERIREEVNVYHTLLRAEIYLRRIHSLDALHRILLRRVEHTYFKNDKVIQVLDQHLYKKQPLLKSTQLPFHSLCAYLYQHGDDRTRTRAVLCHVYHQALHGHFFKAREMLLMSQVQGVIHQADISTQALFNRTLMQLGLSAFRQGLMRDSYTFLHGMLNTGHAMELFGAGCNPVNIEVLEMVYLTVSMLLEVPNIASHPFDQARRRILSKPFRKNFEVFEKSAFVGPPESDLDFIMAAAKALFQGNAPAAYGYLSQMACWKYFEAPDALRVMLQREVREVAMVTWIHTHAQHASSICLAHLAAQFHMDLTDTRALVCKMIKNKDIHGHIDGVNDIFILARPTTKLQWLSNQLADKLLHLSELHQKIYETKPTAKKPTRTFNNANRKQAPQ